MAYIAPQTYRITDPIENLRLCVTVRKRATEGVRKLKQEEAAKPERRLSQKRLSLTRRASGAGKSDDDDEGENDAGDADSKLLHGEREEPEELLCEPRTFRWQEKAFSREEVKDIRTDLEPGGRKGLIGGAVNIATGVTRGAVNVATGVTKAATLGIVDLGGMSTGTVTNYQRAELERLDRAARDAGSGPYEGEIIYTRVHSEQFSTEWTSRFTDSAAEVPTPLARAVDEGLHLREHRDMMGEAACVSMHVLATLPIDKADDGRRRLNRSATPYLGKAVKAIGKATNDLLLGAQAERREEEVVLCELRLFPQGRLDIRPPLSYDVDSAPEAGTLDESAPRLARWYGVPGTRFEYRIENIAESDGAEEHEQAAIAERLAKLGMTTSTAGGGLGGGRPMAELDFPMPPRKVARVHYFLTLDSASGFDADSLYVAYYALAAPGWKLLPNCAASAVTQTSHVRALDQRAVLGFPIELALESEGPPTAARPPLSLFFSVVSRDLHERMAQLGYAHISPPAEAGMRTVEVQAWRLAEERTDALRRYFIGGTEELSDLRALALPDGFDITSQPQCLNKHGLQTVTTGMLHLQLHTVVQQYQTPKPAARGAMMGAMGRPFSAKSMPQFQREKPGFGALKGAMMVGALARQPSAVDRVLKRLQERKRAEGTDDDDGAAAR